MDSPTDTAPVVDPLDWAGLEAWLRNYLPGLDSEMEAKQFTGGHANLTYCVSFGRQELVLRRPPFGTIAPGAHDMAREYRVLNGLAPVFDRAPRALAFCDDLSVIGAPFVVIERRRGEVVRDSLPESLAGLPNVKRRVSDALIDALAEFHSVEPASAGLETLGRPDGFLERQVAGWHERWRRLNAGPIPLFDEVHTRLVAARPRDSRVSLVHNDFKFDNCMFASGEPDRVTSIFDWDMATLGDPLVDLGTLLSYWQDPDDEINRAPTIALDMSGFPSRAALVNRYAAAGHGVDHVDWYEAFATWKLAVVLQQLYQRFADGHSGDERLGSLGEHVPHLIEQAHAMLSAPGR